MSAVLRLLLACLLCAGLAACGGGSGSHGSNKQQIESMFTSIDTAMAKGDYVTACNYFSQHQQATIVAGAHRAGLKASGCAAALTSLIKATGLTRAQLAQTFGGGGAPKLHSVSVTGDQATVTYTSTIAGRTFTETDALVRESGQWKADRIISRKQTG
jgi:DNA-binding phage protein